MIMFDTLKLARRLREAGLPAEQAEAIADALAEALRGFERNKLAPKNDIVDLRREFSALRKELHDGFAELRAEIRKMRTDLCRAMAFQSICIVGLTVGLMKLL